MLPNLLPDVLSLKRLNTLEIKLYEKTVALDFHTNTVLKLLKWLVGITLKFVVLMLWDGLRCTDKI